MELSHDTELLAIYREELESRTSALLEGARALARGPVSNASDLFRDAHTIKGSSRVMGFEALGEAGQALEFAWRGIADGTRKPTPELAAQLLAVTEQLLPVFEADPVGGSVEMRAAVADLSGTSVEPPQPQTNPPPPPPPPDRTHIPVEDQTIEAAPPALSDLGGLVSALEQGLIGTATRVETTKLYRLINRAAETRLDAEALADAVRALRLAAGNPREIASLAARWEEAVHAMGEAVNDLQTRAVELVSSRFGEITATFEQFSHYLARRTGKEVRLEVTGADVEVDRQILEHLREPLRHLIVNAVDHGIEPSAERVKAGKPASGRVTVRAAVSDAQLHITVQDDGRGVDWQAVRSAALARGLDPELTDADLSRLLFSPGFSTVHEPTELSGDGRGLALSAELAEKLRGGISIESTPGKGTTVMLGLPVSWAFQDAVLLRSVGRAWGIPAAAVTTTFPVAGADVRPTKDRMELVYQGRRIPIGSFGAAIGAGVTEHTGEVVVLATRSGPVAVTVPEVLGRREVAVKSLGPVLAGDGPLIGAAVLGGGELVVMVDPNKIADQVKELPVPPEHRPKVLVVDDSKGVRQLVASVLSSQGFDPFVARHADEAIERLAADSFDALVVDFKMPGPDGVELVQAVRRRDANIPVVMVSAVATSEDQARAWEAGVDAYLDKADLRQGLLVSTLSSLLAMRSGVSR